MGQDVATGKGKIKDDGTVLAPDVKKGDKILFGKYSGTEVKIEDDEYLILGEDDILGVIEK
jgi:chaperonin GroES